MASRQTRNVVINGVKGLALGHLIAAHYYTVGSTWGASMLPTIEVLDDWVLVNLWYRRGRGIRVGDVVQFDTVYEPGGRSIKRVMGMDGDYVLRNTPGSGSDTMLQVPRGHCWLAGDNLPYSRDSRELGPVPIALIRGKIVSRWWPWKEMKWIGSSLNPLSRH